MSTEAPVARHRIDALIDGVYAIAITLLVLELKLPPMAHGATDANLRYALVELLPKVLAWLLSFWVMALFWLGHQRVNHFAGAIDRLGVGIELAQLALIGQLPFSTALMGEHGNRVSAAAVHSANLLGLALLSLARAAYLAAKPALHTPAFTHAVRKNMLFRRSVMVLLCGVAFGLAYVVAGWNMLALLPMALVRTVARRFARQ